MRKRIDFFNNTGNTVRTTDTCTPTFEKYVRGCNDCSYSYFRVGLYSIVVTKKGDVWAGKFYRTNDFYSERPEVIRAMANDRRRVCKELLSKVEETHPLYAGLANSADYELAFLKNF